MSRHGSARAKRTIAWLSLLLVCLGIHAEPLLAQTATDDDEYPGNQYVNIRMVLESSALVPGETTHLALVFDISQGWHMYWRNPGDSGMAASVAFKLPTGITIGKPQWPVPERHASAGILLDYIFEKQLVLIYPLTVSKEVAPGKKLAIEAEAEWLVCSDKCVPGKRSVSAVLETGTGATPSKEAPLFEKVRAAHPLSFISSVRPSPVVASWHGRELSLRVEGAEKLTFFPYESSEDIYPEDMLKAGEVKGDTIRLKYPDKLQDKHLVGGVVTARKSGKDSHYEILTAMSGG